MVYSPQTKLSFVFIWVTHAVFTGLKTVRFLYYISHKLTIVSNLQPAVVRLINRREDSPLFNQKRWKVFSELSFWAATFPRTHPRVSADFTTHLHGLLWWTQRHDYLCMLTAQQPNVKNKKWGFTIPLSKTIKLSCREADHLFQRDYQWTVAPCPVFHNALLVAAWILLSCSDTLPRASCLRSLCRNPVWIAFQTPFDCGSDLICENLISCDFLAV